MRSIVPSVVVPAIAVILWRIHASLPATWLAVVAGVASVAAIAFSMAAGLRRTTAGQVGTPRRLGAIAALGTAVALIGWWPTLWPCPVTCAGGDAYAVLLGLPIQPLAAAALGLVTVIGFSQAHRTEIHPVAELTGWACVGASAYYLFLSATIALLCGHCLAVHTVVLCLVGALLPGSGLRAGSRTAVVVVAALGLHALYHPVGQRAAPLVAEGELSTNDVRFLTKVDHGRRLGASTAPVRLEMVMNLHCKVCREHFLPVIEGLRPVLADGRAQLVVRHYYRDDIAGMERLTPLAMAAAADGSYLDFAGTVMGAPTDLDPAAVDAALPERFEHLPAIADRFAVPIAHLLAADDHQLRMIGAGPGAPHLLLIPPGEGQPGRRWSNRLDPAEIVAEIERLVPRDGL